MHRLNVKARAKNSEVNMVCRDLVLHCWSTGYRPISINMYCYCYCFWSLCNHPEVVSSNRGRQWTRTELYSPSSVNQCYYKALNPPKQPNTSRSTCTMAWIFDNVLPILLPLLQFIAKANISYIIAKLRRKMCNQKHNDGHEWKEFSIK